MERRRTKTHIVHFCLHCPFVSNVNCPFRSPMFISVSNVACPLLPPMSIVHFCLQCQLSISDSNVNCPFLSPMSILHGMSLMTYFAIGGTPWNPYSLTEYICNLYILNWKKIIIKIIFLNYMKLEEEQWRPLTSNFSGYLTAQALEHCIYTAFYGRKYHLQYF